MHFSYFGFRLLLCFSIIHNRYRFERIFFAIFKLTIQIKFSKLIITKLAILTVSEHYYFFTGHTVEFDINSFSVIFFRV